MTFGRVAGALIACSLLGLAGCADAEPIEAAPSASATLEDSAASASPSAPESPEPETAKQFIRRWPLIETEMINTGETAEYRAISGSQCTACTRLAERVDDIYQRGGYAQTSGWQIDSIARAPSADRTERVFVVRTTAATTEFRNSAGAELKTLPGGAITHQITIGKSEEWLIVEVVELGSPR